MIPSHLLDILQFSHREDIGYTVYNIHPQCAILQRRNLFCLNAYLWNIKLSTYKLPNIFLNSNYIPSQDRHWFEILINSCTVCNQTVNSWGNKNFHNFFVDLFNWISNKNFFDENFMESGVSKARWLVDYLKIRILNLLIFLWIFFNSNE